MLKGLASKLHTRVSERSHSHAHHPVSVAETATAEMRPDREPRLSHFSRMSSGISSNICSRTPTIPSSADDRALRRYRHRWIVERTMSWLQNSRRLLVRHEYSPHVFDGFVTLACLMFCLKWF